MPSLPPPVDRVVRWAPLRLDDAPAVTAVYAASRRAEGSPDEVLSLTELSHDMEDPGLRLDTDSLGGWSADGRLLTWGWVWCRPAPVQLSRAIVRGDVHPDVRRAGIGRVLLDWQLARATERLTDELPAGLSQRIDLFAPQADAGRAAIARSVGLAPIRWFHKMQRALRDPIAATDVPAGLETVAWTETRSEAARDARNDGWRDHWGFEPMPMDVWRHLIVGSPVFLRPASRLAVDGDRVVGMVLCAEQEIDEAGDGRTAWLDLIAVRREWRRHGVASALISAALVALAEEGFRTVSLDVDADSETGALGLYERHGFRVVRTETLFGRDMPVSGARPARGSRR